MKKDISGKINKYRRNQNFKRELKIKNKQELENPFFRVDRYSEHNCLSDVISRGGIKQSSCECNFLHTIRKSTIKEAVGKILEY